MDASEFASKLSGLAPAKSRLLSADYEHDEADQFINTFQCVPRRSPLGIATHNDRFLELMDGWDISKVEIGSLCFPSEPVVLSGYLEVGLIENDKLVFCAKTGDHVLLDHESGNVLCRASHDGETLLNALLCIAGFYSKTAVDEVDIDDQSEALKAKAACVHESGGEEFETFCTTMLGV